MDRSVTNLVPKRANVDLKKQLRTKMDKLNKQTEKGILNLLSNK